MSETQTETQEEAAVVQDGTLVEEVEAGAEDPKDFEFPNRMDIRIVSDGVRTSVFDAEGRAIGLVQSIVWKQNVKGLPVCHMTLLKVPVTIVAKGTKVKYKSAYKLHRSKERFAPPLNEDVKAADDHNHKVSEE